MDNEEFNEAITRLALFYAPGAYDFSRDDQLALAVETLLLRFNDVDPKPDGLASDVLFTPAKRSMSRSQPASRVTTHLVPCHKCGEKVPLDDMELHFTRCPAASDDDDDDDDEDDDDDDDDDDDAIAGLGAGEDEDPESAQLRAELEQLKLEMDRTKASASRMKASREAR